MAIPDLFYFDPRTVEVRYWIISPVGFLSSFRFAHHIWCDINYKQITDVLFRSAHVRRRASILGEDSTSI